MTFCSGPDRPEKATHITGRDPDPVFPGPKPAAVLLLGDARLEQGDFERQEADPQELQPGQQVQRRCDQHPRPLLQVRLHLEEHLDLGPAQTHRDDAHRAAQKHHRGHQRQCIKVSKKIH